MKGLSIKRVVALGLGAALVGSALAPVVSAAVTNNLDTMKKSDIVSDAGVPVVDVVVGSKAAVSDVVWAGNIATRVAQLATTPATVGGVTTKTVDFSVGGVQTTTGSGNTDENVMNFTSSSSEFNPIKADYSDSSKFVNIAGRTIKYSGVESQINIDENINVVADVELQTIADGTNPGDVVAKVGNNGVVYSLNLGTGIPYSSLTQWDSNSSMKVKIPLFGSEYVVDEASSTKMILYKDTTPTELMVGNTLTVAGVGTYAGKTLTIELVDLVQTGSGTGTNTYQAKWALKDGETVLKYVQKAPAYDLKDEFGTDYFTDSIYVSLAGLNLASNKYTATVRTGSSRLEIRNNEVFPYDSTKTTNPEWKAYITSTSGTKLNGSDGIITKIQIKNNWSYNQAKTETTNSKLMLGNGGVMKLPMDYAKFEFKGLQTKPMAKAVIGGSTATITDSKGIAREIPMMVSLGSGTNTFTIAGSTYLVDVNTTPTNGADVAIRYWHKPTSSVSNPWGNPTGSAGTDYDDVQLTTKDVNTETAVGITVDSDWKTGNVDYYLGGDETTSQYWLFLAAQAFDLDSKSDTVQKEIIFAGTDVDQNANNGLTVAVLGSDVGDVLSVPRVDLNYYLPDQSTYNVLTAERANTTNVAMGTTTDSNVGNGNGTQAGKFYTPSDGDAYQYVSFWKVNEGSDTAPITSDMNLFINGQTGYLVNSTDNKTKTADADKEVKHASFSLDEYTTAVASKLTKAVTNYGSTIEVAGGVATIWMPEEVRKVEAYVGSMDTVTSTVGGESFKAVAAGTTKTTAAGTKVTVDAVNAAGAAGDAVSVVKAGNLVKTDASYASGKSIIVGGWLANSAAKNLQVASGQTLEDMLTASGDYVAAVLDSGSVVVAGYTGADTGMAAQALISALEGLM